MKIIGKTKDGFILDCSKTDVYNLIGFYSNYSEGSPELKVGDQINIHDMYSKLTSLKQVERENAIAIKSLKFIIDALEMVKPVTTYEKSEA